MAPEVISLLSSPEPEIPARLPVLPKAPSRTSTTLGGLAQAYDALDRIPESSNPGLSAKVPRRDEFWFFSDDFDITGDLKGGGNDGDECLFVDECLYVDDRPKKRQRLSRSPIDLPAAARPTNRVASTSTIVSRPIARMSPPRRVSKPAAPADLIELSSSPVVPERRATKATFLNGGISDSSDPFGSSPPRKSKVAEVATSSKDGEKDAVSGGHPRFSPKKSVAWDPISSSAPASNGACNSPSARTLQRTQSDMINFDDLGFGSNPDASSDNEFPDDLSKIKATATKRRLQLTSKSRSSTTKTTSSKPRAPVGPKKTAEEKAREKERRDAEREQKKLERELAKEDTKRERERAKEQRAQEKKQAAALAEVNKIRTDKKVSTPEMIVDLPESLPDTTKLQAETLLKDLDVEFHPWPSPVENVVKWRRKVRARYNEDLGHWEPVPMLIEPDKHAMVTMTATQFVDLVLAAAPQQQPPSEPTETLDAHIARMKRHFPDHTLIYLLEGLNVWMRKNRTVRDRHFQAAVRSVLPPAADDNTVSGTAARRREQPAKQVYVDEDLVEDALLALQVRHKVLVHHTAIPLETARQIAVFTQHISTLPYRKIKDRLNAASAGFCMDAGQVRPGDGPRDTFVRMLQEITRVTAPIAYGILGEFGSVTKLVSGMEEGGPLRLEDVRKCADREGTVAERRVGPAVSKRVWKVFTGQNEESNDV